MKPLRVGVVTVGRSDFGIYQPLLRRMAGDGRIDLRIVAAGMHLAPEFGLTVREILAAGFEVRHRVEMLVSSDSAEGTAKSMGLGLIGFGQIYAMDRPDWVVVLGDRFEMFAAVAAALPARIPVAHLHGGELTFGAIDEAMRHSMTKMSHLHFVSTEGYGRRVEQMGEEPWRVTHCGALSLENVEEGLSRAELEEQFGLDLSEGPLLVTLHPTTLGGEGDWAEFEVLVGALSAVGWPVVWTLPNADASGRILGQRVREVCGERENWRVVENFGRRGYLRMLQEARAMVGNSSSGLLEAGAFGLPVVNLGERQAGRERGENVLAVRAEVGEVRAAIERAGSREFREFCRTVEHPYWPPAGSCPSEIIVERLVSTAVDQRLLAKRFWDSVK